MIDNQANTMQTKLQRGFSLIEVLVALIIMSVGMLGIAVLYVQGLQAGRTSLFRHNAVTLASDVADRIRANPTAEATYADEDGADNSCVGEGTDCDATQMAMHDIFVWKQEAAANLPAGDVTVAVNNGITPIEYTITIDWTEPGASPAPSYTITVPVLGF